MTVTISPATNVTYASFTEKGCDDVTNDLKDLFNRLVHHSNISNGEILGLLMWFEPRLIYLKKEQTTIDTIKLFYFFLHLFSVSFCLFVQRCNRRTF